MSRERRTDWHEPFLAALAKIGNVRGACHATGVPRRTAYAHRTDCEAFARAWDEAVDEAVDILEAEAWRRAVEGTGRPVFYQGKQVGAIREYSDALLMFLLKAARPEKYRENFDLKRLVEELGEARRCM
jgi:hypothetical protein